MQILDTLRAIGGEPHAGERILLLHWSRLGLCPPRVHRNSNSLTSSKSNTRPRIPASAAIPSFGSNGGTIWSGLDSKLYPAAKSVEVTHVTPTPWQHHDYDDHGQQRSAVRDCFHLRGLCDSGFPAWP